jgi:hypothetical protein
MATKLFYRHVPTHVFCLSYIFHKVRLSHPHSQALAEVLDTEARTVSEGTCGRLLKIIGNKKARALAPCWSIRLHATPYVRVHDELLVCREPLRALFVITHEELTCITAFPCLGML